MARIILERHLMYTKYNGQSRELWLSAIVGIKSLLAMLLHYSWLCGRNSKLRVVFFAVVVILRFIL